MLTRPMLAALVGTALTAFAAVFLSQWGARDVHQGLADIMQNANPSVVHLIGVQSAVSRAERALPDPSEVTLALRDAEQEWQVYKRIPPFEGETELQRRVEDSLARIQHLRSAAGAPPSREWHEAFALLSERLRTLVLFNLSENHGAALAVEEADLRSRQTALGISILLLGFSILQAFMLGRAAVRLASRQAAYFEALSEERRELEERLRHSERLGMLGQVVAEVSHEIGTPLNIITGRADSLARRLATDAEAVSVLAVISEQGRRITRIVQRLLSNARKIRSQPVVIGPMQVAQHVVEYLAPEAQRHGHELWVFGDEAARVKADPDLLEQMLLNLLQNAMQACGRDGRIEVRVEVSGGDVAISVEDNGPGVPPDFVSRLFEAFATTKGAGKGTGLGLSISRSIARDLGGALVYVPQEKGACFRATLPRARALA